jgi:hypothetical protein
MKIELCQKGDRFFLRKYFLGFIPLYYDFFEYGWWFTRSYTSEEDAKYRMERMIEDAKYAAEFKASPEKVIATHP